MARVSQSAGERRQQALAVLTTGVVGDDTAEQVTWALLSALTGAASPGLTLSAVEIDDAWEFVTEHRVRGVAQRVLPAGSPDGSISSLAGAVAMERRLLETVALLSGAGIDTLVLKGNATAHLDHATPSDREVGDVDLLVRPAQLSAAMTTLERSDYVRAVTHPFSTSMFFHSETFVHPDGTEIDLHHRLAQPSRAPMTCWEHPDTFVVGGASLRALPRSWRFLHALIHQMMNPPPSVRSVNGLTDLVIMWSAGVDVEKVRTAGAEIGMAALTDRGLVRLTDLLDEPLELPMRRQSTGAQRRLAAALDTDRPTPGYLALAANLAVQPRKAWPRYLGQLLWPSPAYRRELGITAGSQVRHVVREAFGR